MSLHERASLSRRLGLLCSDFFTQLNPMALDETTTLQFATPWS